MPPSDRSGPAAPRIKHSYPLLRFAHRGFRVASLKVDGLLKERRHNRLPIEICCFIRWLCVTAEPSCQAPLSLHSPLPSRKTCFALALHWNESHGLHSKWQLILQMKPMDKRCE